MQRFSKDYFNLPYNLSLILAIIPISSWICGVITRILDGKIIAGLIRLVFGFTIIWLLDLIYMIQYMRICRVLNA